MREQNKRQAIRLHNCYDIQFLMNWVMPLAVSLLILIMSAEVQAIKNTEGEQQWTEWKALSSGYLARKKVPAKFDNDVTERRAENVQEQAKNLRQLKTQLQAESNPSLSSQQSVLSLDQRMAELKLANTNATSAANAKKDKNILWLRTNNAGLYELSVADVAAEFGLTPGRIRKFAKKGKLRLANAKKAESWYFYAARDSLIFVGEDYQSFHTDENAYAFRLAGGSKPQPMLESTGLSSIQAGVDSPFAETLQFEQEPDLFYSLSTVKAESEADYWFWDYLFGGFKDLIDVTLDVPNPAPTGSAQLRVTLRGWTDLESGNEHNVYAVLNGAAVGSTVTFDAFEEAILVADFDQSLLNPSGSNTLQLHNSYEDGTHPGQWLDQIEIDYMRMPVAIDGQLWLDNVAVGTQLVSGFSSDDIVVIEAPGEVATLRNDTRIEADGLGGYQVVFDVVDGGIDFLVSQQSVIASPDSEYKVLSTLKKADNKADYMIIAPRDFAGTANALAAYRSNDFSFVKIVWLDEIFDLFSAGRVDPHAITKFMARVNNVWQVKPAYITVIGKGTVDHKNRMGYADSFIPVLFTDTPWTLAASDDRLLGGNGDAPYAIGRMPIINDAQGIAYVNKLMVHEATIPDSNYFKAMLVADNDDVAGDFHSNSDTLAERLSDSLGFTGISKLYHPDDQVRDNLILSSTWAGHGYVSYDGHGSSTQIGTGTENFIKSSDAALLNNTSYPIFTGLTCAVGDFTLPGTTSLATALVLNPDGGAIAAMTPTGLSLDADAQTLGNAFVDSLYGSSNTIGNAVDEAKLQTQGQTFSFMQRIYTVIGDPFVSGR